MPRIGIIPDSRFGPTDQRHWLTSAAVPIDPRQGFDKLLSSIGLSSGDVSGVYGKEHHNGQGAYVNLDLIDGGKRELILLDKERYEAPDRPESLQAASTARLFEALLLRPDLDPRQREVIQAIGAGGLVTGDGGTSHIRLFSDIPQLDDGDDTPIPYLDYPMLAEGRVIGVTGDSGHGKSTLICARARKVAERGIPVLLLDRDNMKGDVKNRFRRLGITGALPFRVWGEWCEQEPPELDSPDLAALVSPLNPKPLIIIDCLGGFYDGDENDSSHMRDFFRPIHKLAHLGCTVVVLHNTGKSENSKFYRGSAAFKDCVRPAFHVSNNKLDGLLHKLTVHCFKSRGDFLGDLIYRYAEGEMTRDETSAAAGEVNVGADYKDRLTELLRTRPGVGTKAFINAANAVSIPEKKADRFLSEGIRSERIRREGKRGTGYRHFLIDPDEPTEMGSA